MDVIKYEGHFTYQVLDKDRNIVEEYIDKNMIMSSARETMSEIFASKTSSKGLHRLILGTLGHKGTDIFNPKTADDGFVKERTRLFSETIDVTDNTLYIRNNDCVKYTGTNNGTALTDNYYIYLGTNSNINTQTTDFSNTTLWEPLGTSKPFTYSLNFELPGANGEVLNKVEDDIGANSSCNVVQDSTSVTITAEFTTDAANGTGISKFTEAALYANDRIFSMKTFSAKLKDSGMVVRIIWAIIF